MYISNIIKNNSQKVKHIFHLADIHIRKSTRRHEEYRQVFAKLYKNLEKYQSLESVIVICGDILHEKCNYNEISLQVVFEFMENLVNLMDVIVIMGNHDGYTLRENRRDALNPIVDRIKGKNTLYYLRDSGVYAYNNILFGVSSVYDNVLIRASDIEVVNTNAYSHNDQYKIALFHGSVSGCKLQNDFILEKYDRRLEDFEGYDYVLLGDIHKQQFIEPTVCYPSSLIQQNHGEHLLNHGYVHWNLDNNTSEFIKLPNDFGYVTISIENNKLKEAPQKFPLKTRLRINYTDTAKTVCDDIIENIKTQYNTIFQTIEWNEKVNHKKSENSSKLSELKDNVRNLSYQNTLMRSYCENILQLQEDQIQEIIKINTLLNKELQTDHIKRSVRWKIELLTFSNMFSYGADNIIDFTKLNNIVGIIAPNHYGKSSILDIILFCLFDRCSRNVIKKDIKNIRKKWFQCTLIFTTAGARYKIIRKAKAGKKDVKSLRVDVDFYKQKLTDSNVSNFECDTNNVDAYKCYECISGADRNETNKIIGEIVGSYEDAIMTCFSLQKEVNFLDLSKSNKIDYLIKLSGINVFDEIVKKARRILSNKAAIFTRLSQDYRLINPKEQIKNKRDMLRKRKIMKIQTAKINKNIKVLDNRINKMYKSILVLEPIAVPIKSIESHIKKLEILIKSRNNLRSELESLHKKLTKQTDALSKYDIEEIENDYQIFLSDKKEQINTLRGDIKILSNKKQGLIKTESLDKDNIDSSVNETNKNLKSISKKISNYNNALLELKLEPIKNKDIIIKRFNHLEQLRESRNTQQLNITSLKKEVDRLSDITKEFENFEYDPNCNFCVANPFTKRANESKSRYDFEKHKLEELENILSQTERKIKTFSKYERLYKKNQKLEKMNDTIIKNKRELENKIALLEKDKHICENKIASLRKSLNVIEQNKIIQSHNDSIDIQIGELEEKMHTLNETVHIKYTEVAEMQNNIHNLDKIILEKEKLLQELNIEYQKIQQYKKDEQVIRKYKEQKEYNEKMDKKIKSLKEVKQAKSNKLKNLRKLINQYTLNVHEINRKLEEYRKVKKERTTLEFEIDTYKKYVKMVSRNGLPYELLTTIANRLQSNTNDILMSLTDFTIEIEREYSKKMSNIEIYKINKDEQLNIKNCSGFEQFIVGLALRLAIVNTSNLPSPNFIIIDEGFSCMDSTNMQNVEVLFGKLRSRFNFVLIISHLDELKSNCDKYIDIVKPDNGPDSHIMYK